MFGGGGLVRGWSEKGRGWRMVEGEDNLLELLLLESSDDRI